MRTSIYIDGFNFYYLTVKNTPYKWLDFKSVFTKLLHAENQIIDIKYFTAIVDGRKDPNKPIRQQTYIRALKAYIPEFLCVLGNFQSHVVRMPISNPSKSEKFVNVIKTEEKGSDVNFAVHLLNDAWLDKYDRAIIVSNDSDLVESVKIVKEELGKSIGLTILPKSHPSRTLLKYADFVIRIRNNILKSSQLPDRINNTNIKKPKEW